jgi:hypothetical protein
MLLQFSGRHVLTSSNSLQFLSQPEVLDVKDRILVAIFCKAGVSVLYSRHHDAEINEKHLY